MEHDFLSIDNPMLKDIKKRELVLRKWENICLDISNQSFTKCKKLNPTKKKKKINHPSFWKCIIYGYDKNIGMDNINLVNSYNLSNKKLNGVKNDMGSFCSGHQKARDEVKKQIRNVIKENPELYEKLDLFYDYNQEIIANKNTSEYYFGYKYYAGLDIKKGRRCKYINNNYRKNNIEDKNEKNCRNNKRTNKRNCKQVATQEKRSRRSNRKRNTNIDDDLFKSLNCLEKRSHKRKLKETITNINPNININTNDTIKEKSFLPTGVFYSRICRSIIANWIDDKTKRQIKIPFKIVDLGLQKASIYAIIARCLRLSDYNKVHEQYNLLTEDQQKKIVDAMSETTWPEKMYTAIIQGEYDEYMKIEKKFTNLMNLSKSVDSLNTFWKQYESKENQHDQHISYNNNNNNNNINNVNNINNNINDINNNINNNKLNNMFIDINKEVKLKNAVKLYGNVGIKREGKGRPLKKQKEINNIICPHHSEKKRIKTSDCDGPLPTGVYFYQGAYVANWWETTVKKQHKVPFKISEYGPKLAKTLAIIARTLRCSNVNEVKLILTKIDTQENCVKMDFQTLTAIAHKTYKVIKVKK